MIVIDTAAGIRRENARGQAARNRHIANGVRLAWIDIEDTGDVVATDRHMVGGCVGPINRQISVDTQFSRQRNRLRRREYSRGVKGDSAARTDGRNRFAQRAVTVTNSIVRVGDLRY
ncbi:MAG TPA: hypothetical protein VK137_17615, partial [Planctomycetaceae bacterium]|nr:hypothetical protein [Planctomycetaceae bacterium]